MRNCIVLFFVLFFAYTASCQTDTLKNWKIGGGLGLDFAQLLLVNPKVGAGENKIAIGGNASLFFEYKKERLSSITKFGLNFGVQKLGRNNRPFQKSVDEFRISSQTTYAWTKNNPFSYALDVSFLSQITPSYEGNFLQPQNGANITHPIAQFFAPATLSIAPGIGYQPHKSLTVLLSPIAFKAIMVANDSIAQLGNDDGTASLHGTPFGKYDSEDAFLQEWGITPRGLTSDSSYYARTALQMGATLRMSYKDAFLKFKDKAGKERSRLAVSTTLVLFSNYLRDPQNIDVEWITTVDLFIVQGLSISIGTNLFYDHDVLVQVDRDRDPTTGVNGYESTGRRVSFTENILIKYSFLF